MHGDDQTKFSPLIIQTLTPCIKQTPDTVGSKIFKSALHVNGQLYYVNASDSPLGVFLKQVSLNTCRFNRLALLPTNKSYMH